MRYWRLPFLMLGILFLAGFADPDSQADLVEEGYAAILHGQWWIVAGVALSALHLALRTYGPWKTWLGGGDVSPRARDLRGFVSVLAMGLVGGFGHALLAGASFNQDLVLAVVRTTATAIAVYVGVKKAGGVGGGT